MVLNITSYETLFQVRCFYWIVISFSSFEFPAKDRTFNKFQVSQPPIFLFDKFALHFYSHLHSCPKTGFSLDTDRGLKISAGQSEAAINSQKSLFCMLDGFLGLPNPWFADLVAFGQHLEAKDNPNFLLTSGPLKIAYLVSERKLGFFVQIKEDENFNRRNTLSISRLKIWVWRRYGRKRQFSFRH